MRKLPVTHIFVSRNIDYIYKCEENVTGYCTNYVFRFPKLLILHIFVNCRNCRFINCHNCKL